MRTMIDTTRIVPPRLAVPPPARPPSAPPTTGRPSPRPLYRRHATTLGAMAVIAVVVLLLDGLMTVRSPGAIPLWLLPVAGMGAVMVGAGVRRTEARSRPMARTRTDAGESGTTTAPAAHAASSARQP